MASRGINKVILIGNLGQDPDIRYMPNGNAVANITLATSESWKDKQTGEKKEQTEWHRVVLFGKLAEIANEYLRKGSQIYIEGQLRTRKWIDQSTNQDKYTTEVIVGINGIMQMLGNRQNNYTTLSNNNLISSNQKEENWNQLQTTQKENKKEKNIRSYTEKESSLDSSNNESTTIDFDDDIPF